MNNILSKSYRIRWSVRFIIFFEKLASPSKVPTKKKLIIYKLGGPILVFDLILCLWNILFCSILIETSKNASQR